MQSIRLIKKFSRQWNDIYRASLSEWKVGLLIRRATPFCHVLQIHLGTISSTEKESALRIHDGKAVMSKAMKAYIGRAREHEKLMEEEIASYEIGKRHLANMMGEDPETFTQDGINQALSYLLPSGLYDSRARPQMEHPTKLFPKRKAAEFDEKGRPFHTLFYTGRPTFYQLLQDIAIKAEKLDNLASRSKVETSEESNLDLQSSKWISKTKFESIILEKIPDNLYEFFITSMERLLRHRFASTEKSFFMKYREDIPVSKIIEDVPQLLKTDEDIPYITQKSKRKTAIAEVTIYGQGSGKFQVNGQNILYFENPEQREQILFPLQFTNLLKSVDVQATVREGGPSGQAGAIRFAISMALRSFVGESMIEKMRIAGLLTADVRKAERQKPGQRGARAKKTWKKR